MTALIYGMLAGLGQAGIIWVVTLALIALFFQGLRREEFRQAAPALMTSLGIFGTFCGIFVALYPLDFSPERINNSIEELLNGMTTAFVTSLLGIFFAIVFRIVSISAIGGKLRHFIQNKPPQPTDQQEILNRLADIRKAIAGDGDSMVAQMQKLRDENRTGFEKMEKSSETTRSTLTSNLGKLSEQLGNSLSQQQEILNRLADIRKAIAGDGDSMVAQMQKLRDENQVGFKALEGLSDTIRDELVESLNDLIQEIRQIIGDELSKLLKELIDKFQDVLINKLGESFKEFNEATQALKKWQDDHRQQVKQLTNAFNLTAKGIARIAKECGKIPPTMDELREVVETAHGEVESLKSLLEAIDDLRKQAETNLDKIVEKSAETFEKIAEDVKGANKQFSDEMHREINRVAMAWGDYLVAIAEKTKQAIDDVEKERE